MMMMMMMMIMRCIDDYDGPVYCSYWSARSQQANLTLSMKTTTNRIRRRPL